ncbi:MAG: hypothetical protein GH148_05245 [Clostridia bacterium]|nr:hypothetical protein [Clostridia bacterium]
MSKSAGVHLSPTFEKRDPEYTNLINLVGIDSPGLTASLAIARYVSELLRR